MAPPSHNSDAVVGIMKGHHGTVFVHASQATPLNRTEFDARVAAGGFYFGASRGFWIVLATCVGSLLLTFAAVIICVSIATSGKQPADEESEDDSDEEVEIRSLRKPPPAGEGCDEDNISGVPRPVRSVGFLQRYVFRADLNGRFANSSDIAMRFAVLASLFGLTYWCPSLGWLNEQGWSMQYVVVILSFTLYTTVGSTVSLAWSGFWGTLAAVVNCLLMFRFFPQGVSDSGYLSEAWWFGIIDFVLFTLIFLALNPSANARMFALSWQAYFTMCFLNPHNTAIFSSGLRDISLMGGAIGPLMGTIWGCLAALACSLFPHVLSALGMAQDLVLEVSWHQGRMWERMVMHSDGTQASLETRALQAELKMTSQRVTLLKGYLADGWWECFDIGRGGRMRAHLAKLGGTLEEVQDCLRCAVEAIRSLESSTDTQASLLGSVHSELESLAHRFSFLLYHSAGAAVAGDLSPEDEDRLRHEIRLVQEAQRGLESSFARARKAVSGSNVLTTRNVPEHAFIFALSACGRCTTEYAEYLLEGVPAVGHGLILGFVDGLKDMTDPAKLFTVEHAKYAMRSSLSFWTAMFLGRIGIPLLIPDWNSTPPGTIAYLLSDQGKEGSAVKKNYDRFVGVCGGTMVGLFIMVMGCVVEHKAGVTVHWVMWSVVTFTFLFLAFYTYINSTTYSYIALLVACFGAEHILLDCDKQNVNDEMETNVYRNLMAQLVAIATAVSVDYVVGNRAAWSVATEALGEFNTKVQESLGEFLRHSDQTTVAFHKAEGLGLLATCVGEGGEAALEPRARKTPWRSGLWDRIMGKCFELWTSIAVMEYAAVEDFDCGGKPRKALCAVLATPALQQAGSRLLERAQEAIILAQAVMKHNTEAPLDLPSGTVEALLAQRCVAIDGYEKVVNDVSVQVAAAAEVLDRGIPLEDEFCQAGVVLMMVQAVARHLASLEDALVQEPDVWRAEEMRPQIKETGSLLYAIPCVM